MKKLGILNNWDGIPAYDLDNETFLLNFDEEQREILSNTIWGGNKRVGDYFVNASVSLFPGLSPAKMEALRSYLCDKHHILTSQHWIHGKEQLLQKKESAGVWLFLSELIHSNLNDWQFMSVLFVFVASCERLNLFTTIGNNINQYNGLELLMIGTGILYDISDYKSVMSAQDNEKWVEFDKKIRKICLAQATKHYRSLSAYSFSSRLMPMPKNIYRRGSVYNNYMNKRNDIINNVNVREHMKHHGVYEHDAVFTNNDFYDSDFNKNGEYIG